MNWFSIPNFSIKVVPFIYAIGGKGFYKGFYSWRDEIYFVSWCWCQRVINSLERELLGTNRGILGKSSFNIL